MARTSDFLIESVLLSTFSPDASDITTAQFLAWGDEVVQSLIASTIRPGREGYWLTHETVSLVPGTVEYTVPARALARGVRGVMAVMPSGRTYGLTPADPLGLRQMWDATNRVAYQPSHYAFEEQTLRVNAVPAEAGWSLRVFFLLSPPKLIPVAQGLPILAVTSPSELSVTGTPDSVTFADGALFDVVSGDEPFQTLFRDVVVSGTAAGVVETSVSTFTVGPPSVPAGFVQNRDQAYAVPAGTTVYPPIVGALWPSLVEGVAAKLLEAIRDPGAMGMRDRSEVSRQRAVTILEPRDDRRARSVVGESALRMNAVRRGWGRGWR